MKGCQTIYTLHTILEAIFTPIGFKVGGVAFPIANFVWMLTTMSKVQQTLPIANFVYRFIPFYAMALQMD